MASSESSSVASLAPSKPRIRISMPLNLNAVQPTPVRQSHDEPYHKVTPTPVRADSKPPPQNKKDASSLPELPARVISGLRNGDLEFPINDECTSLTMTPNGRLVVAGFSDGTLRLFDLASSAGSTHHESIASASEDDLSFENNTSKNALVCSKAFQRYGAVACQIHARGVHTSLLMHVDCSQDGLYCFGGVIRGSMELVAVDLSNISSSKTDLLDLIRVHRHSDAKLKGFGACTRLEGPTQKYLLLTGKGIKNIHVWSFEPSKTENQWQCLYDTQTNGNTISMLHLRYDPNGLLQAMSKSDSQKLRIWDLSYEQHGGDPSHMLYNKKSTIQQLAKKSILSKERPKRPPYVDVASTESALGIAGAFCFGGGFNQLSVVSLDVENVGSPYNHTELALPRRGTSRRQQRGDLQSIVKVAGITKDANHVLLELSNGSVVHYLSDPEKTSSRLEALPSFQAEEGCSRNICLERIGAPGLVVAAMSTYYTTSGRGSIVLHPLDPTNTALSPAADKKALAAATVSSDAPSPNQRVQLFGATPKVAKKKKYKKHRATIDVPHVTSPTEKEVVARVSLDSNAGDDPSMTAVEGVAVSPEQRLTLSAEPKQKPKKKGAMTKYLRAAEESSTEQVSKVRTSVAPQRLQEEQAMESSTKSKRSKGGDAKRLAGAVSKKPRTKTPPKEALMNASNRTQKSEQHGKAKAKLTRSPSVPRKRQHKSLAVPKPTLSQFSTKDTSLLEVAGALCDIRRGTPSPKRSRPNTGVHQKKAPREQTRPSHPHRKRPRALTSQLPQTSIVDRVGPQNKAAEDIASLQEASRMKLAAEHRACHEMLRRRVLSSVDSIIRSLSNPQPISDSEARICFNEEMYDFKNMLEDMLERQRMEASSLAAEQSLHQKGYTAPEVQVSFPFPDLFDTATTAFERFMDQEKKSL